MVGDVQSMRLQEEECCDAHTSYHCATNGIANFTPDSGPEVIFYPRSSYQPLGRTQTEKHFPRRDLLLNSISEKRVTNELLQRNLSVFFFVLRFTVQTSSALAPTFVSVSPPASLRCALGSHKHASSPSILIARDGGNELITLGGSANSHLTKFKQSSQFLTTTALRMWTTKYVVKMVKN